MTYSFYQNAAAYDLCRRRTQEKQEQTIYMLVVDMDRCAAGICSCAPSGRIQQIAEVPAGETTASFFQRLGALCGTTEEAARTAWKHQSAALNSELTKYIRTRGTTNPELSLLHADGTPVSCSEVDDCFRATKQQFEKLLEQADLLMEANQIALDEVYVLPTGYLAYVKLAEHELHAYYSPTPFLADPNFASLREGEEPERFAELGQALYAEGKVELSPEFGHSIGWLIHEYLSDGTLSAFLATLASSKQTLDKLQEPHYTVPVLLSKQDSILLHVDGKEQRIPLPQKLIRQVWPDSGSASAAAGGNGLPPLFQGALTVQDGEAAFWLRNTAKPQKVYQLPIAIK